MEESTQRRCVTVEEARACVVAAGGSGCPTGVDEFECILAEGQCVSREVAEATMGKELFRPSLARALLAEAVGTMMIVLFGCGSVCSSLTGAYAGIWQVAAIWGLGVALAIFTTDKVSGAHLNPAVTLAFWLVRPGAHAMTVAKSALYMLSQLLGGILGGAVNLAIYSDTIASFERANHIVRGEPQSIRSALAFGEYFPNPGLSLEYASGPYKQSDVSMLHALFVEAWGTAVLCFVIFTLTHDRNPILEVSGKRAAVPVMIGSTVAMLLALYAPITQAGWNPARDFGPRIVAALGGWGSVAIPGPRWGFWIYIVGPLLGGPLGAVVAERVLHGALLDGPAIGGELERRASDGAGDDEDPIELPARERSSSAPTGAAAEVLGKRWSTHSQP